MLKEVQRDRILTSMLLASAALLLYVVVRDFGSGLPDVPRAAGARANPIQLPAHDFSGLFNAQQVPSLTGATNRLGAFYTLSFQPPPKPQPPPPPTTRQVPVTYLGFYESQGTPRRAVILLGETRTILPAGSNLIANIFVSSIENRSLVLTNLAGATNVLPFDVKANLEVPIP